VKREDLYSVIPAWLSFADEALAKYGRWAMDRNRIHTCGSAEGRYVPELQRGEALEFRREARESIIPTPDALKIHRALLAVPELQRKVLHILYVPQRMPIPQQLRLARIPPKLCQERHRQGLQMFANVYQRVNG
jgi:hypothetical protein